MDELAERNRKVGASASNGQQSAVETIVRERPKIGRNEKVIIRNVANGKIKELKFKQAEPMIRSGQWVIDSN